MRQATTANSTKMFLEVREAPSAVAAQRELLPRLERLARRLRERPPALVMTCGRGSSDHAATYAQYLIATRLGIPAASTALSTFSIYGSVTSARDVLCIAISQSGRSPDLLQTVSALKKGGAFVLALVNDAGAPLADLADEVLELGAGIETSVAATKSYIASLSMIARLVAAWARDHQLVDALDHLPEQLAGALELDWSGLTESLASASNAYVLGRGLGLAVAQEAALKFKETCGVHAEAFSSAELYHGPMALVRPGFPVLMFTQDDEAGATLGGIAKDLADRGATVLIAGNDVPGTAHLSTIKSVPVLQPILQVQTFYRSLNELALTRGLNPDEPPHLKKITSTI